MTKRASIILYLVALLLLALWAYLPISWETSQLDNVEYMFSFDTISILSPLVSKTLFWCSIAIVLYLLILSSKSRKRRRIQYPIIAFLIAIVAFPFAGLKHVVTNLGPWRIYGRVTDATGQKYVFCDSSFLQGQTMAIGMIESEDLLVTKIKVYGITNGDSPRSWASVVRPANPQNTYGQLYLTDQRMLVGVRYDNHCFLAYDLYENIFYGHDDIERVSPFICLNADDELCVEDIAAIRKHIKESTPDMNGYPHRDALETAINHPNPRVKAVTESLLEAITEQSPQSKP